jgi:choline dehydrogenase
VFSERGLSYVLSTNAEVIQFAGAFQSPQLLMLSGIGPKDQLATLKITVVADRPGTGQNMWEHLDLGSTYQLNVQGLTSAYSASNQAAVNEYIANHS